MTPPSRPPRFLDAALGAVALLLVVSLPGRASAQACCAGGAVVTPTRLAPHEDLAVGVQVRARTNPAAFDARGGYASSDGLEQVLEQDVAASLRIVDRAQAGLVIPTVQTHRSVAGLDDWGGGLGDVALTARYDFLLAAETLGWPGIAVLAASSLPTGTPPDGATHPLAADATGAGTFDLTLGLGLEKVSGHLYAAVDGWVTHRFARRISRGPGSSLVESFGARWTLLAVVGYVFDGEAALGAYLSAMNEGPATIDGVDDPTTRLRSTTAGAAGVLPLRDLWRLQGSLFMDLPFASFGRNEPAGYGLTASIVRVWQ
jgi:hypothetical protein